MSFKFCPECGNRKGPFIKGFCKECFLKKYNPLIFPERIDLSYCSRCSKIKIQRNWIELNSIELIDFIKSKIKSKEAEIQGIEVELEKVNEKNFNAFLKVKTLIDSIPLLLHSVIKLRLVSGICDACMKISSDYFEATIQLRFSRDFKEKKRVLDKFQELINEMNKSDALARIVKINKLKNGVDLVLSSNRAAKVSSERIAKKYNKKITRSFSVVGTDKTGKEKRRYTYCIRF